MTKRLEEALKRLNDDELAKITEIAETLPAQRNQDPQPPRFLKLDWVGKGADLYPEYKSGVEAQHAAMQMWIESIERGLSK